MAARRAPLHYAWVIAILTFLTLIVVSGIRSASGVLFVPLEHTMGWTAASISLAVAINVALYGALGPFAAACMEAIGIRATVLVALGIMALATAASAYVMTPFQLVLTWGIGVGVGTGIISMVLVAVVATRWFHTRRGLVYGVLTGSTAAGQLIFLPLLAWVAQTFGWRNVGFTCALAAVLVAIPVALLMRDRPDTMGLLPLGATPADITARAAAHHGTNPFKNTFAVLKRASRKRDFWIVAGTFFVCGATTNGYIGTHFMAICGDDGISQVHAAGYVAVIGVFSLIGSSASGWLSDRYASRYLLFGYYACRGIALFLLPYALLGSASAFLLPAFTVFYGLDWLATGAPNIRALTEALGKEDTPIAVGWVGVSHQLGAGTSALLAGVIRTNTGSYVSTFELYGFLAIIAAVAALGIGVHRRTVPPIDVRSSPLAAAG